MKTQVMHRQGALLVIAALLGALGFWTVSYATGVTISACVSKDGYPRLLIGQSTTCKKDETLITWSATGERGPKGDTGMPGPEGSNLRVIDQQGQDLGILINTNFYESSFTTYRSEEDTIWEINQAPGQAYLTHDGSLYYTQLDCMGTVYGHVSYSVDFSGTTFIGGEPNNKKILGSQAKRHPMKPFCHIFYRVSRALIIQTPRLSPPI